MGYGFNDRARHDFSAGIRPVHGGAVNMFAILFINDAFLSYRAQKVRNIIVKGEIQ